MANARTLVTAATAEPVTVQELRDHLRILHDDEDLYLEHLIKVAREVIEHECDRQFVTATWDVFEDEFPIGRMPYLVPLPPLASVTSVKYYTSDTLTTWGSSNYTVDTDAMPGRIEPVETTDWPDTDDRVNAVEIRIVAGYGAASAVPEAVKQAILVSCGHWYENREELGNLPDGVRRLVDTVRWTVVL